MTDNTQELDEILKPKLLRLFTCDSSSTVSVLQDTKDETKQAIIDWHNKQIEKSMAKFSLKKGVKYDVKASDSVIVITPVNKLEAEL